MVIATGETCLARIPAPALTVLAEIRTAPGVRVARDGAWAWIRWQAGSEDLPRHLLPVHGVRLYEQRNGQWHEVGHLLPAFDVPASLEYRPLFQELTPAPIVRLASQVISRQPVTVRLMPDVSVRPATAMECAVQDFAAWTDEVPSARLEQLRAAHCDGRLLVRGARLPLLPGGQRFWGEKVLVPLGFSVDPALPDSAYREALDAGTDDILLFRSDGCEIVPAGAFSTVTRAGIKLLLH